MKINYLLLLVFVSVQVIVQGAALSEKEKKAEEGEMYRQFDALYEHLKYEVGRQLDAGEPETRPLTLERVGFIYGRLEKMVSPMPSVDTLFMIGMDKLESWKAADNLLATAENYKEWKRNPQPIYAKNPYAEAKKAKTLVRSNSHGQLQKFRQIKIDEAQKKSGSMKSMKIKLNRQQLN